MNRKTRKILFIRSKNYMKTKGYKLPKWNLMNHQWPTKWKNMFPSILDNEWVIDMQQYHNGVPL